MSKHTKYDTIHKYTCIKVQIFQCKKITAKARDDSETFLKPCKSSNKVISYSPRVNKT